MPSPFFTSLSISLTPPPQFREKSSLNSKPFASVMYQAAFLAWPGLLQEQSQPCLQRSGWSGFLSGCYFTFFFPKIPYILPSNCPAYSWRFTCTINEPSPGIQCVLCSRPCRWAGGAGGPRSGFCWAADVRGTGHAQAGSTSAHFPKRMQTSPCAAEDLEAFISVGWPQVAALTAGHMMAVSAGASPAASAPSSGTSIPLLPGMWRLGVQSGRRPPCFGPPSPSSFLSEQAEFPTVAARGGAGRWPQLPGDLGHETQLPSRPLEEDRWDRHLRPSSCQSSAWLSHELDRSSLQQ